jgi:uncharacterized DUF497 family protein
MTFRFEWDDEKAQRNLRKHGVSFEEAQTVFDDPLARVDPDSAHSISESRAIIIGYSDRGRLLLVSFVERNDAIRIINSRAADARERKRHEEENI